MKRLLLLLLVVCCGCIEAGADVDTFVGIESIDTAVGVAIAAGSDNCSGGEKLGFDTVGDTAQNMSDERSYAVGVYTAPCTGTLDDAYVYGTQADDDCKLAVYLDDGDGSPDSGDTSVGKSASITGAAPDDWYTASFSGGSITKDSTYWLVVYVGDDGWEGKKLSDTGSHHSDYDSSCNGYDDAHAEITNGGGCDYPTDDGFEESMYATLAAP